VQVIAENKDIPSFTPQQMTIVIDEETTGIVVTNETIIVSDRDAVSMKSLMFKTLMMKLDQSDLKTKFFSRSKHSLSNKNQSVNYAKGYTRCLF
jgi:flagellar basal body P-ring protein FlgI